MPSLATSLRWAAFAAVFAAYLVFAHVSTAAGKATFAGALVAIGPVLAFALVLAWRSAQRWPLLGALAVGCGILWANWGFLERNFSWVYFLQNAGTNALLGTVFASSLLAGRTPTCTQLAEIVHPEGVPLQVVRYTRQVTVAWATFFLLTAILSVVLFFAAPIEIWSVFANLLAMPLVGVMFVAEYAVRLRVLPPELRPSMITTARVYWMSKHKDRGTPTDAP